MAREREQLTAERRSQKPDVTVIGGGGIFPPKTPVSCPRLVMPISIVL